jgi:hypothetical protein
MNITTSYLWRTTRQTRSFTTSPTPSDTPATPITTATNVDIGSSSSSGGGEVSGAPLLLFDTPQAGISVFKFVVTYWFTRDGGDRK